MPLNINNNIINNITIQNSGYSGIFTDGLVLNFDIAQKHSYPMGGTTWYDLSGNGNNGTLVNVPVILNGEQESIFFNGVDNYINIPHSSTIAPSTGVISTEVWFRATEVGSENGSILINKENEYEISAGGGVISYAFRPNWAWVGATAFNIYEWYCVCITYNQSYQRMYINGIEVYSAALTGAIGNVYSKDLRIAARNAPGTPTSIFQGEIPIVRVYNRALSASEVFANYNALKNRFAKVTETFYENLTVEFSGNLTVTGNDTSNLSIFKTSGGNSWDNQSYSRTPFTAPCTIEFNKQADTTDNSVSYAMIGWNSDPTTDASYTSLDYASYPYRTDTYSVYNNGSQVHFSGAWSTSNTFYIVYDTDGYIRHYNGSTLLYSVNYGTGNTVYLDSSYYSANSTYGGFSNIRITKHSWNGTSYV